MTKKAKAIRGMGKEQMLQKITELKKELLKMNSQIAVGTTPESPGRVKQIKKEIARIFTIMSEPVQKARKQSEVRHGTQVPTVVKKPEAKSREPGEVRLGTRVTQAASAPKGAAVTKEKRLEVGKTK